MTAGLPTGGRLRLWDLGREGRWPIIAVGGVLSALALGALVAAFGPTVRAYPLSSLLAVALFGAHALLLAWLIRGLDYLEPEPPLLLFAAAVWGGLIATANAVLANDALFSIMVKTLPLWLVQTWGAALAGPAVEETLKALGVVAVILAGRRHINSALDGVVYGAFVGLGFQEVENVIYSLNAVSQAQADDVHLVWGVFTLRGLFAGLWSHAAYSGIAGAGIAYAVVRTDRSRARRAAVAAATLFGAWACHFLWNSPILTDRLTVTLGGAGTYLGMVVKGGAILGLFLAVVRWARRDEYERIARSLRNLDEPYLVTEAETAALVSPVTRGRARFNAYVEGGAGALGPVAGLQRAQADLGLALAAGVVGAEEYKDAVAHRRRAVRAAGVGDASAAPGPPGLLGWLAFVTLAAAILAPPALPVTDLMCWLGVRDARRHGRPPDPLLWTVLILAVVVTGLTLITLLGLLLGLA